MQLSVLSLLFLFLCPRRSLSVTGTMDVHSTLSDSNSLGVRMNDRIAESSSYRESSYRGHLLGDFQSIVRGPENFVLISIISNYMSSHYTDSTQFRTEFEANKVCRREWWTKGYARKLELVNLAVLYCYTWIATLDLPLAYLSLCILAVLSNNLHFKCGLSSLVHTE